MKSSLNKTYLVITGVLIAVTGQVNGYDCCPKPCCGSDWCSPCNLSPYCGEIMLKGDLLIWRPQLCGLESAFGSTVISTSVSPQGITTTTVTESDVEPKSDWNAGFRVGANLILNCCDLEADWTHFNGGSKHRNGPQHGNWNIKYDTFDLTSGCFCCLSRCFYLKPFIGMRAAKIDQTLNSRLETLFTSTLVGSNIVPTTKDDEEKFWGLGPELGLEADWYLRCNFSIYGSIDAVYYYGEVKSRNFDVDAFTSTVSVSNGRKKHCFDGIATDASIGIRWDKCWCCSCYETHLMLRVGLEQHRIYDFSELGSDGTLSLDGGIIGGGIAFRF